MYSNRKVSDSSTETNKSIYSNRSDHSQCVICMNGPTDIILSPCKHGHCCLKCFRRSTLHTCPLCRTTVTSITVQSTGTQYPFNPPPSSSSFQQANQNSINASSNINSIKINNSNNNINNINNINNGINNSNNDNSNIGINDNNIFENNEINTDNDVNVNTSDTIANSIMNHDSTFGTTFHNGGNGFRNIERNGSNHRFRPSTRIEFDPPRDRRYYRDHNSKGILSSSALSHRYTSLHRNNTLTSRSNGLTTKRTGSTRSNTLNRNKTGSTRSNTLNRNKTGSTRSNTLNRNKTGSTRSNALNRNMISSNRSNAHNTTGSLSPRSNASSPIEPHARLLKRRGLHEKTDQFLRSIGTPAARYTVRSPIIEERSALSSVLPMNRTNRTGIRNVYAQQHSQSYLPSKILSSFPFNSRPDTSPPPRVIAPPLVPQPRECIMLIGSSRSTVVPLAQKLLAAFPPPKNDSIGPRLKSTIFICGEPIRLILIDTIPFSMRAELAARIYRHAPNLILLCADYTDITSFEKVIRIDMEILDYIHFPCLWVVVRAGVLSKRQRRRLEFNTVDEPDICLAKQFIVSERHCLFISVDNPRSCLNVKKLGSFFHSFVKSGTSSEDPSRVYTHRSRINGVRKVRRQSIVLSNSLLILWSNFAETRQKSSRKRRPRVSLSDCWSMALII